MKTFRVLHQFEKLYNAVHPAVENSGEAFIWLSDIPHPLLNAVMHLSDSKRIDSILQLTKDPLSFWLHSENEAVDLKERLVERGFVPMITCPLMIWPVKPVSVSPFIERADEEEFLSILSTVFEFNEEVKRGFARFCKRMENYTLSHAATGSLFALDKSGLIANVSVLPEFRRRGLATEMMKVLMQRAFHLGLEQVILLSSPASEQLYADLGFVKYLTIEIYMPDPSNRG